MHFKTGHRRSALYQILGLIQIFPHCIQLCPIAIVHPESGSSQPFTPLLSPTILNALLLLQIFCFMFETCHRALCYSSYLVEFYFTQNWKCQKLKSEFLKVLINGANFQKVKNWQNVNFFIGDMYLERAQEHEWGQEGRTDRFMLIWPYWALASRHRTPWTSSPSPELAIEVNLYNLS